MSGRSVDAIAGGVTLLLHELGVNRTLDMSDTPSRHAKMMLEMTMGYDTEVDLTTFPNDAEYDQMITQGPIQFASMCSHHLVPFFGDAWVGYIPNGNVVGLSKLARLVEKHARRLQMQERMTNDIGRDLLAIDPAGVAVKVRARHLCMEIRGVRKPGTQTTTTFLHGAFKDNLATREEFLRATT